MAMQEPIHFVFGYGSLIQSASRSFTLRAETMAIRATLRGYQRVWGATVHASSMTAVTLVKQKGSKCNGVIFPVTRDQLMRLDRRESGYDRVAVPVRELLIAREDLDHAGWNMPTEVEVYVARKVKLPNRDFPISQSYVDVILTGCLQEFQKGGWDFAREFIRTTAGWGKYWVNDRRRPRYRRRLAAQRMASAKGMIDRLLDMHIGLTNRKRPLD